MVKSPAKPLMLGGSTEPFVRPEQLAALLNVHKDTPNYWVRRYRCPHLSLPGGTRYRLSEVENWLKTFNAGKDLTR